jgi:hypothetical protein
MKLIDGCGVDWDEKPPTEQQKKDGVEIQRIFSEAEKYPKEIRNTKLMEIYEESYLARREMTPKEKEIHAEVRELLEQQRKEILSQEA